MLCREQSAGVKAEGPEKVTAVIQKKDGSDSDHFNNIRKASTGFPAL